MPGLSIALVDDQKLVWSAGFGYADEARHRSAQRHAVPRRCDFKLVTAAGVMRAADGRLALDMPAAQALPQWEIQPRRAAMQWLGAHPVTARSLLTLRPDTPEDTMGRRVPTWAALLGDMVAHAAEEPLRYLYAPRDLAPLNISRAGYQADERMLEAARRRLSARQALVGSASGQRGRRGLWMSSSEMARFSSMLFAEGRYRDTRVLKAESAQAILNLETVADGISLPCRLAPCPGWSRPVTRTASRATRCVRTAALPKPFIPAMYWPARQARRAGHEQCRYGRAAGGIGFDAGHDADAPGQVRRRRPLDLTPRARGGCKHYLLNLVSLEAL